MMQFLSTSVLTIVDTMVTSCAATLVIGARNFPRVTSLSFLCAGGALIGAGQVGTVVIGAGQFCVETPAVVVIGAWNTLSDVRSELLDKSFFEMSCETFDESQCLL